MSNCELPGVETCPLKSVSEEIGMRRLVAQGFLVRASEATSESEHRKHIANYQRNKNIADRLEFDKNAINPCRKCTNT